VGLGDLRVRINEEEFFDFLGCLAEFYKRTKAELTVREVPSSLFLIMRLLNLWKNSDSLSERQRRELERDIRRFIKEMNIGLKFYY